MKTILVLLLLVTSCFGVNSQSFYASSTFTLLENGNKDSYRCVYLGSNKNFNKNYFHYNGNQNSGILALDTMRSGTNAIFCTDFRGKIQWIKPLYTLPGNSLIGYVEPVKVDEDRLIVLCTIFNKQQLYFNNKKVNENPQSSVILFIDTTGARINIPFELVDSQKGEIDFKISNITSDGTFAFSVKKFASLTLNNKEITGDSGIYICKVKVDFKQNQISLLSYKKIGINLNSAYSQKDRHFWVNSLVLENKSLILYNPSSSFLEILDDKQNDTKKFLYKQCYFLDKDLQLISSFSSGEDLVQIKTDLHNNVCIVSQNEHTITDTTKSFVTVLNAQRDIVRQDTFDGNWSISFNDKVVYLLKKNFVRHNLKQISYNFDLKRIDIAKKNLKTFNSTICDNQYSNDVNMNILSNTDDEVTCGFWIQNRWEFDWEKGCIMSMFDNGFNITNLYFR